MKSAAIQRMLPEVYRRTARPGGPLAALLGVMEGLHAPSERILERIPDVFNPHRAPDAFVPVLAAWLDLERIFDVPTQGDVPAASLTRPISTGLGRLRELVASAAHLSQWRGTARGLLRFLEIATGMRGFAVDERVPGKDGRPVPFHIRVRVPRAAAAHRALIERIVRAEKPAYVTHELEDGP
ncbi:MAG TPA: phage tail protein [Planctomycetota bacterium]|nr:phage tail protein [Planctomycetota bacterium]